MSNSKNNLLTLKNWSKKLLVFLAIVSCIVLISFPVIAQYRRAYGLFRPYAYWNYPYRRGIGDDIIKALNDKGLTDFAKNLQKTNFYQTLNQKRIVTIFAPSNKAFKELPYSTRQKLRQNLERILKYHIVPEVITEEQINQGKTQIVTLEGSSVKLTVLPNDQIQINNASNTTPANASNTSTLVYSGEVINGQVNNGEIKAVIIKIDRMLLPPNF